MERENPSSQDCSPAQNDLAVESRNNASDFAGPEHPPSGLPEVSLLAVGQIFPYASEIPVGDIKRARRVQWEATGYVPPIVGGATGSASDKKKSNRHLNHLQDLASQPELGMPTRPHTVKYTFNFDYKDLSPDGKKLFDCLLEERGDRDLLSGFAVQDKFNLPAALAELRKLGILDESSPYIIRLSSIEV